MLLIKITWVSLSFDCLLIIKTKQKSKKKNIKDKKRTKCQTKKNCFWSQIIEIFPNITKFIQIIVIVNKISCDDWKVRHLIKTQKTEI